MNPFLVIDNRRLTHTHFLSKHKKQPPPVASKPRRVYAANPEVAPVGQAPWPNSLQQPVQPSYAGQPQQQQQQQPMQPYPGQPQQFQSQPQFQSAQVPPVQSFQQPVVQQGFQSPSQYSSNTSTPRHHHAGVGYTNAPYTNTSQQLPPELRPPVQPRPRIDPDQMPAPVQVRENDQELFEDKFFGTMEREHVPLATTDYIGLDQGNCNPRFMRSTVDRMPFSKDLADRSKLTLGLIVQPLAKTRADEVGIQVVNHGEEGPIRCTRCRAYINPWCIFTHGGSKFECNVCAHSNDVPEWYFSNIDMSGRRVDANERPELRYGSVEFEVPKDYYSARTPAPLSYVFALDVSIQAVQSGMLQAVCEALKSALYDANGDSKFGNRIGIITFDKGVHFYNLTVSHLTYPVSVISNVLPFYI